LLNENDVETVALLSKLSEAKHHIEVKVDMDELDLTSAEAKATYKEIQDWVQEMYGFHVTNLNIAQVKQKHGIIERENYNKSKSENSRQPGCPEEKVKAIEEALKGRTVAVISSGDSGVYGMAGLVLEMILNLPEENRPQFEIIAGVSAVNAAAAILGAPLMNDFAIISLSDLITPWELIKRRVRSAAEGDFVIALYNPKSKRRVSQLAEVQQILLQFREKNTPVGIVTNAGRDGQSKIISTLENFIQEEVNMFSLVIIGNSQTFIKENFMITPRGYKI